MAQVDDVDPEFRQRQAMLFADVQRLSFAELSCTAYDVQPPSATSPRPT